MKKILDRIFIFAVFAVIFINSNPCPAQGGGGKPALVKDLRAGFSKEGIRIVVDLSSGCDFQVRSLTDSSVLYLDIFDARLDEGFKIPNLAPDNMMNKISVSQYNFRQVKVEIPLAYGIPIDNVHCFPLKDPDRIVIDLFRDYNKFIQFYITKNILWMQTERAGDGRFTLINEVYVNQKSPEVIVDVEFARGKTRRETVDSMVKRTGAIAGVNGGYFGTDGTSLGLVVKNGKIVTSSVKTRPERTAVGMDFDKNIHFNRLHDINGQLQPKWGPAWNNMVMILGAGPRLISKEKVHISDKEEALGSGGNDITRRAGRTALGVNKDGNLVMMTASGFRSNQKDGMKLPDLAQYMLSRGIVDAMNLDGGGSTAMSIMGNHVSKPPMEGSYQRPVANALLIYDKSPIISPRLIGMDPEQLVMPADGVSERIIRILVTDAEGRAVPDGTAITVTPGVGLFETGNYYTTQGFVNLKAKSLRAPGNYSVKIDCGPIRVFLPVKLQAGPPGSLLARVRSFDGKKEISAQNGIYKGSRFILDALVRDEYKNTLQSQPVEFKILEGEGRFSTSRGLTRPDGIADSTFILTSPRARVQIISAALAPITMEFQK